MAGSGKKVIKISDTIPVSFLTVFSAVVFLYLVVEIIVGLLRTPLEAYSVGAAVSDNVSGTYRGIILRNEEVTGAPANGTVTLFCTAGEYRKKDSLLAAVDADGTLVSRLYEIFTGNANLLSKDASRSVHEALRTGSEDLNLTDFKSAYAMKASVQSVILECLASSGSAEVSAALEALSFSEARGSSSGFFAAWCDGLEGLTEESLTAEILQGAGYEPVMRHSGDRVKTGDFLYKIMTDNAFRLCFPLTAEEADRLRERKTLTVETDGGISCSGDFTLSHTADGKPMGILKFQRYGGNFCTRYLNFRILDSKVSGFKIPEKAIVSKDFFVVDRRFITSGGSSNANGVLVLENGEVRFIPCTVYVYGTGDNFVIGEDVAYIQGSGLLSGMTLVAAETDGASESGAKTAVLSEKTGVEGVYQINKGYCVFKPIVRLKNSLESSYVMVSASVRQGLQAYDRIVLNASGVEEKELIFE